MEYWIATHYPHVDPNLPWHIYFRKSPKTKPSVGDKVLFYETQSSKDGKPGRRAIVCEGVVSSVPKSNVHGDSHEWHVQIECDRHKSLSISLEQIRTILGNTHFYRHTLTELDQSQYKQLSRLNNE